MCKYCEQGVTGRVRDCANGVHDNEWVIMDKGIVLMLTGYALGYIDAHFCPECGRDLKGE